MAKSTDEILASLLLPCGSDWRIKDVHSDDPNESIYVEVEYSKPDIIGACRELNLYAPVGMGIVFDGGNYVRCGNKVVMTDKIFSETNKQYDYEDNRRTINERTG